MKVRGADSGVENEARMLSFEVEGAIYALPIDSVLEVTDADRVTCVPGLADSLAGVINWHGDALPIVTSAPLLLEQEASVDIECDESIMRDQILVLSNRAGQSARMGLPVDRVVGLIDSVPMRGGCSQSPVVERRQVDGRVISVLDPHCLLARAEEVIERTVV